MRKLYLLTTRGLGSFYIVATDELVARVMLEKELHRANYGFIADEQVIKTELLSAELVRDRQYNLQFSDKQTRLIICEGE